MDYGLPDAPASDKEIYLANIAGQDEFPLPEKPASREEQYLDYIAKNGGGGGGGTTDYNQLTNKPKINGVTLQGNKSASDLSLAGLDANTFTQTQKVNSAAYAGMKLQDGSDPSTIFTDFGKTGMYISDGDGVVTLAYKNIANKTELAGKQDTLTAGQNISIIDNVISATGSGGTTDYTALTNKPQIAGITLTGNKSLADLGIQALGDTETYTVATTDWTALASATPYTYSATVTATHTIGNNTIVELYNDNPVLFAANGFAVGSVSGQSVVLYSIGIPSASVSLKVNYKG